mmetsp:Transcript_57551/g.125117  ORF Transcript_57551/g.125117 Transcript_57551/m.125117 type:complete len:107 (+) Transcript_57551:612-932(+)
MALPPTLFSLNIAATRTGDVGIASVSDVLPSCPSLTELNLSRNWIGDSGAQVLCVALPQCSSLTRLNLSGNRSMFESAATALDTVRREGLEINLANTALPSTVVSA